LQVKDPLGGDMGIEVVTARGMDDPFGFARCPGGVENEEHIFTIHWFCGTIIANLGFQFMPPMVAIAFHVDFLPGALHHQDVLQGGDGVISDRLIHLFFQRHNQILAPATISSNHQFCLGIFQTTVQSFGAESAKYHRMRRPDSRTS